VYPWLPYYSEETKLLREDRRLVLSCSGCVGSSGKRRE
jgi:hypothetical protein